MFRFYNRGLQILGVLCLVVLLVVYSLHHNSNLESLKTSSRNIEYQPDSSPKTNEENTTGHLLISLVNLQQHPKIARDFYVCLSSICKLTSIAITLHVVTDNKSQGKADKLVGEMRKDVCKDKVHVEYHDIGFVVKELEPLISVFKDLFNSNPRSYFSHALFFLSIISHNLFPHISKLIILDADLKFRSDIRKLWDKFDDFAPSNLIGIAHELQPVYKHIMYRYRNEHPQTKIGAPPPDGNPGFNSGVLLMNLARLRDSILYKAYLSDPSRIRQLAEKYYYKGHLGDQGFYTLLSFDHPELFYILPCSWNRQLCTWWKDKGYDGVFHLYHNCEGYVNVYHGNCGTPIPND